MAPGREKILMSVVTMSDAVSTMTTLPPALKPLLNMLNRVTPIYASAPSGDIATLVAMLITWGALAICTAHEWRAVVGAVSITWIPPGATARRTRSGVRARAPAHAITLG